MKACVSLAVLLVLSSVLYSCNGLCDEAKRVNCKTVYTQEITDAGEDIVELCQAIYGYQVCVEAARCTVPYDMGTVIIKGRTAYKCGATGITLNLAVLLLTSLVALKNFT